MLLHSRAQQLDQYRHIEAWTIAEDILNSILNKIVSSELTSSSQDNNSLSSDTTLLTVTDQEESILGSVNEEDLAPLNDTVREQDKIVRLTILQKLLELACAMVTLFFLLQTLLSYSYRLFHR